MACMTTTRPAAFALLLWRAALAFAGLLLVVSVAPLLLLASPVAGAALGVRRRRARARAWALHRPWWQLAS
jgi:uncharacterized membrane protein YhaH (DUF805 family)